MIFLEAISEKTLPMAQERDYSAGHRIPSDPRLLQMSWAPQFRWSRNAITRDGAPVPSVIFIGIMCSLKPVAGKAETNISVLAVRR